MSYVTSLLSKTSITNPKKKLTIKTLNTEFDINENVEEIYYKFLNYCINDTNAVNKYKTTVILNETDSISYANIYIQKWGIFENYFKAGNYL